MVKATLLAIYSISSSNLIYSTSLGCYHTILASSIFISELAWTTSPLAISGNIIHLLACWAHWNTFCLFIIRLLIKATLLAIYPISSSNLICSTSLWCYHTILALSIFISILTCTAFWYTHTQFIIKFLSYSTIWYTGCFSWIRNLTCWACQAIFAVKWLDLVRTTLLTKRFLLINTLGFWCVWNCISYTGLTWIQINNLVWQTILTCVWEVIFNLSQATFPCK